ncbi:MULTISPECIES: NifU family protein [unclassified Mucilaginibacter]|uniref:NifU family protein n=1 Tax=unclassified Mucilaginibacter TaxID=2617802 RepID=UPI002AC9775C|nr:MULTISPECIES: NifU family protein [unclassified Mucilaginibacter]MEB0260063.1 NifU family protein [Mucilaginibacter sp. 10I4]MEB0280567.1 NifU family protein [Mucilaginibacter sp. 10B2]MEB0301093.1 NifU family protein [Mucilaginibacter sp. 5C4]WPX22400.1 NifU family protein [Mucilaginibacter sp. 5C4]
MTIPTIHEMNASVQLPHTIYAQMTPNPASMKFILNSLLIKEEGKSVEFRTIERAEASPLAKKLFEFPYVKGVFIAANFVTVTQDESTEWHEIIPELKELIKLHIASGEEIFSEEMITQVGSEVAPETISGNLDKKIMDLLDEFIRPSVEGDGGTIHFKSFLNGKVTLVLKGACNGCPSTKTTLKQAVENLLRRMVPEVEEVIAETA